MDSLRPPFLFAALACFVFAFGVELSTDWASNWTDAPGAPGYGIAALAWVDALLLLSVGGDSASRILPGRLYGVLQPIVSLLVSLSVTLGCFGAFMAKLALLFTMVGLLLAPPFGTAAYFAEWGDFDTDTASICLTLSLMLKEAGVVLLLIAQQKYLGVKSLVLMVATSLVATFLVGFFHGFPPGPLVSIADVIAALVAIVLGGLWAVFTLIFSVLGVVRAIRAVLSGRATSGASA
jgi:hypothetical protein